MRYARGVRRGPANFSQNFNGCPRQPLKGLQVAGAGEWQKKKKKVSEKGRTPGGLTSNTKQLLCFNRVVAEMERNGLTQ